MYMRVRAIDNSAIAIYSDSVATEKVVEFDDLKGNMSYDLIYKTRSSIIFNVCNITDIICKEIRYSGVGTVCITIKPKWIEGVYVNCLFNYTISAKDVKHFMQYVMLYLYLYYDKERSLNDEEVLLFKEVLAIQSKYLIES